jgi:hypothetical protein
MQRAGPDDDHAVSRGLPGSNSHAQKRGKISLASERVRVSTEVKGAERQKISKVQGSYCRIYIGGSVQLETKEQVGVTAGKVWHILSEFGPQTMAQLKKRLNGSGELVGFALGWLAREDKIDILQEKKNLKVTLK